MKKIGANLILPVVGEPIKQGYLIIDNDNCIVDIVKPEQGLKEVHGLAFYSGILIPGLILGQNPIHFGGDKTARILFQKGVQAIDEHNAASITSTNSFFLSDLNFEAQLRKLTIEAAEFYGLSEHMGSFEKGKRPGVLCIEAFDFKEQCLRTDAIIKRLL